MWSVIDDLIQVIRELDPDLPTVTLASKQTTEWIDLYMDGIRIGDMEGWMGGGFPPVYLYIVYSIIFLM